MPSAPGIETQLRELTGRRKPLAERFEKNPTAIRLALEIKVIDDQIAECNRQIQAGKTSRKRTCGKNKTN
jgi:hypothetical protein